MSTASFGVLSQNTGFYPSLDRIVETMLGPLNLGPGGGSYNEPISCLHHEGDQYGNDYIYMVTAVCNSLLVCYLSQAWSNVKTAPLAGAYRFWRTCGGRQ